MGNPDSVSLVEARLSRAETKFRLMGTMAGLAIIGSIAFLSSTPARAGDGDSGIAGRVSLLERKVGVLETTVAAQGTAISNLQTAVTSQGASISALQSTVNSQGSSLAVLQSAYNAQATSFNSLKT